MLARRLLLAGTAGVAPGRYWIIPGGKVLTQAADGSLRLLGPADGWPNPSDSGDVYVDAQRRVGFPRWHYHGGPNGEVVDARIARKATEELEPHSLGTFPGGQAGERVRVYMTETGYGLGGSGHTFWRFALEGGGASHDTGYTADWSWDQQDNGDSHGNPTIAPWLQTIQSAYTPGLAYPLGVCAARNLAVVLRQVATTYSDEPAADPTGRPWLGWTMDAAGNMTRVADLTLGQAKDLAASNGYRPPEDSIVVASDQSHSWSFMRPIGIVDDDTVQATGVFEYAETYLRTPTSDEWPYLLHPAEGYDSRNRAIANDDAPTTVIVSRGYAQSGSMKRPVEINETRRTFVFCIFDVTKAGITNVRVTGRTSSRDASYNIVVRAGNTSELSTYVHALVGGGYLYVIAFPYGYYGGKETPEDENSLYRLDGKTFPSRHYTSPNGWTMPIIVTQVRTVPNYDGSGAIYQDDPAFMPKFFFPQSLDGGAQGPPKPDGWNDATQGPWIQPPNDIPYDRFWRGNRYVNPAGQVVYGAENNTYLDTIDLCRLINGGFYNYPVNPLRNGAFQGCSKLGQFVVGRFPLSGAPFYTTHLATGILPGTSQAQPVATDDGYRPAVRMLQWPGRSIMLAKAQSGAWTKSMDGGSTWQPCVDLGRVNGTTSAAVSIQAPDPPTASS